MKLGKTINLIVGYFIFTTTQTVFAQGKTIFTNVNVLPMTQEIILQNHSVIVEDGSITAISPSGTLPIPGNAEVIDGRGAYLMPGLSDMHTHLYGDYSRDPEHLILYVAQGVTSVRSVSGAPQNLIWKKQIEQNERIGPTIYTSGPVLFGLYNDEIGILSIVNWFYRIVFITPLLLAGLIYLGIWLLRRKSNAVKPSRRQILSSVSALLFFGFILAYLKIIPFMILAPIFDKPDGFISETASQVIAEVNDQKEIGYHYIKPYDWLTQSEFLAATAEAKKIGMHIAGHAPDQIPLETVVTSGMDEIVHVDELLSYHWKGYNLGVNSDTTQGPNFPVDYALIPHTVELLKQNNIDVVTTLVVDEIAFRLIEDAHRVLAGPEYQVIPKTKLNAWETKGRPVTAWKDQGPYRRNQAQPFLLKLTKALHDAGVRLTIGMDAGVEGMVPGFHLHRDLELLVEAELTAYQALSAATKNAGEVVKRMGLNDNFGTIEIGQRGDFILIRDNPLDNVSNTQDRIGVMIRGNWFTQEQLDKKVDQYVAKLETMKK